MTFDWSVTLGERERRKDRGVVPHHCTHKPLEFAQTTGRRLCQPPIKQRRRTGADDLDERMHQRMRRGQRRVDLQEVLHHDAIVGRELAHGTDEQPGRLPRREHTRWRRDDGPGSLTTTPARRGVLLAVLGSFVALTTTPARRGEPLHAGGQEMPVLRHPSRHQCTRPAVAFRVTNQAPERRSVHLPCPQLRFQTRDMGIELAGPWAPRRPFWDLIGAQQAPDRLAGDPHVVGNGMDGLTLCVHVSDRRVLGQTAGTPSRSLELCGCSGT